MARLRGEGSSRLAGLAAEIVKNMKM